MGVIRATTIAPRIRVAVAITSTENTVQTASFNKLKAATQYVLPTAVLEHIFIVLGVVVDSVGYNKFIKDVHVVADHASVQAEKNFFEVQATTDSTTYVLFKKGTLEALHTAETRTFSMAKSFTELLHATDDFYGSANIDDDETMSFGKSRTDTVTKADVRVNTVGKRATDTVSKVDVQTTAFGKRPTDTTTTSETKTFAVSKTLNDAVHSGDEFNATALTDDGEVMVFGKTLADTFTPSDFASVQAEKAFADGSAASDYLWPFELGKGLVDVPVTSETMAFGSAKTLDDTASASELAAISLGRGASDRVYYGDGPNAYDTYALSYFLEDYAREGFPALTFNKRLLDTVHSTDDFYGVANADDDETMQFGKGLVDLALTSDTTRFAAGKSVSDLFTKSDAATIGTSKSLADTFGKSDSAAKGTDKSITDATSSSEIVVRSTGKGLSDSAATGEYKTFALSKKLTDTVITTDDFLGNANADDDETMLLNKAVSDSFTKSDSVSIGPGKGLADTASTSESGSMVWTDYWDIGYTVTTSSVYVGNRTTF